MTYVLRMRITKRKEKVKKKKKYKLQKFGCCGTLFYSAVTIHYCMCVLHALFVNHFHIFRCLKCLFINQVLGGMKYVDENVY